MIGVIERIEAGLASDTPSRVEWRTLLETALTEIKEIRHHHDEFVVAATIKITDQNAEIARLRAVIERLGSSEALTHTHTIPATLTGDELRARIDFARAAISSHQRANQGEKS